LPDSTPPAKWLRPEFQGREDELIHLAGAAKQAGVTRAAVTNWGRRHADFPKIVVETGSAERPTKFIVRSEFDEFLVALKARKGTRRTGTPRAKQRPRATIAAADIARLTQRITELRNREKKQAAKLKNTRAELRKAETLLEQARDSLSQEADAVAAAQETVTPEAP
jgi:ElaB/YqjD/DUF883 family membrane-anchored ribosome-binding protein